MIQEMKLSTIVVIGKIGSILSMELLHYGQGTGPTYVKLLPLGRRAFLLEIHLRLLIYLNNIFQTALPVKSG